MARNQKLTGVIGGRTVAAIRQQGTTMNVDFTDGSSMEIQLQEETSSVMVRDKDNKMEYAD